MIRYRLQGRTPVRALREALGIEQVPPTTGTPSETMFTGEAA